MTMINNLKYIKYNSFAKMLSASEELRRIINQCSLGMSFSGINYATQPIKSRVLANSNFLFHNIGYFYSSELNFFVTIKSFIGGDKNGSRN